MERVHRSAQRLALFVTLGLVLGSTAQAISIVGVAATTNPGDSGSVTTLFGDIEGDSFASVRNAGGSAAETLGATVTAGTRYAQYLWADSPRS